LLEIFSGDTLSSKKFSERRDMAAPILETVGKVLSRTPFLKTIGTIRRNFFGHYWTGSPCRNYSLMVPHTSIDVSPNYTVEDRMFKEIWGSVSSWPLDSASKEGKLDTMQANLWMAKSLFKFNDIGDLNKIVPSATLIFDAVQKGKQHLNPILHRHYPKKLYATIQNTSERQLYHLTEYFHERQSAEVRNRLSVDYISGKSDFYTFACRIKGFSICHLSKFFPGRKCFDYTFMDERWYDPYEARQLVRNTMSFMKEKGWKQIPISECKKGDVIFYFDDNELHMPTKNHPALHVGTVHSLFAGKIILKSKFGSHDVMLHELEIVPDLFGNTILAMRPILSVEK
jgi:hypothetical protein